MFIGYGESAGARTQDQRLKRAMLYQLSYALKPHYQVSTFSQVDFRLQTTAAQAFKAIELYPVEVVPFVSRLGEDLESTSGMSHQKIPAAPVRFPRENHRGFPFWDRSTLIAFVQVSRGYPPPLLPGHT